MSTHHALRSSERATRALVLALCFLATSISCTRHAPLEQETTTPRRITTEHLPNAHRLHAKVISGGQPEGDAAFAELRDLGVRTIISVDGAKPDVATAAKYGLRYVHLPHGYDGISTARARELAKAVRDLPGPVYIHCHHGKHRSPAAATVACVSLGLLRPEDSLSVLRAAGTSENYRGLYRAAQSARPLDERLLDDLKVEFCETVEVPPLAEAMVEIEHVFDRLQSIAKAGWRSPPDHPDLDPAHEALLLKEQFTELARTEVAGSRLPRFAELLRAGVQAAGELEAALRAAPADEPPPAAAQAARPDKATAAFDRLTRNCTACHREFRDVPRE